MYTRFATHEQPASFDNGVADRRFATIAKITRSTTTGSSLVPGCLRPSTTSMIVLEIPNRSHSRSATHAVPIGRASTTLTSPDTVAATASAGFKNRDTLLTRRASASRSTRSARPKLWMIRALGIPVSGSRSLWANAKYATSDPSLFRRRVSLTYMSTTLRHQPPEIEHHNHIRVSTLFGVPNPSQPPDQHIHPRRPPKLPTTRGSQASQRQTLATTRLTQP